MATKPTVHAEWDTDNTNVSATTAGHKSDGWANNEIPTAAEMNYWQKQVSDWTKWILEAQINDGVVDYTHVDSVQDDHDLTGTGNLTNVHTVYITPSETTEFDWLIQGIVGGVDKQEIQLFNIDTSRIIKITDEAFSSSTAGNKIVLPETWAAVSPYVHMMPGGSVKLRYDADISMWRLINGTGVRVCRRFSFPANMLDYDEEDGHDHEEGVVILGGTGPVYFPIPTIGGSRFSQWKLYASKLSTTLQATMTARLWSRTSNSVSSNINTVTNNANSPGYITLTGSGSAVSAEEVSATSPTKQYYLAIDSYAADLILHLEVDMFVPV